MLIFISTDVQYLQKAVFSFEKGLIGQNYSSSGSHRPVKKSPPPSKISHSLLLLTAIWKTRLTQKYLTYIEETSHLFCRADWFLHETQHWAEMG